MNICINKNEMLTLDFVISFLKGWEDIDYPISLKVRDGTITAENINGAKAAELVQKVGNSSSTADNLDILINVDVKSQEVEKVVQNNISNENENMHDVIRDVLHEPIKDLKLYKPENDLSWDMFFKNIKLWPLKNREVIKTAFICAMQADNIRKFDDIYKIAKQKGLESDFDMYHLRNEFKTFFEAHPELKNGKKAVSVMEVLKVFNNLIK